MSGWFVDLFWPNDPLPTPPGTRRIALPSNHKYPPRPYEEPDVSPAAPERPRRTRDGRIPPRRRAE